MPLEDILGHYDVLDPAGGPIRIENLPTPGPRAPFNGFRTANGYLVEVQSGWPAVVLNWVEDAFNACGYDIARLWCIYPLYAKPGSAAIGLTTMGEPTELRFVINHVQSSALPDFPNDYVAVDTTSLLSFGKININIWEGLPSAPLPYGGRVFFMETILHAIGHVVGTWLAAGDDLFKRFNLCVALAWDRIANEYGGMDKFGYGFAWRLWADDGHPPAGNGGRSPWALRPQERFAEAFKDTWGLPSARRFTNRTRAPAILLRAVLDEAQVFLPINYVDVAAPNAPNFGWLGFRMEQVLIALHAFTADCIGNTRVCYEPEAGGAVTCVPCMSGDPNQIGFCGRSFSYPLSEENYAVEWSMRGLIPRIGFCRNAIVSMGQPKATNRTRPRGYTCPGTPGVGADYLKPFFAEEDLSTGTFVDGTKLVVTIRPGGGVQIDGVDAGGKTMYAIGTISAAVVLNCHVEPYLTGTLTEPSDFRVEVKGWAAMNETDLRLPDSFDFLADPFFVGLGYHHIPGHEARLYAPSTGRTFNAYGQLNLDGVDRGAARVPIAAGNEAAVEALTTGIGRGAQNGSLTIEGG